MSMEGSSKTIVEDSEPLNAGNATKTPLKGRLTILVQSARQLAIHRSIGVADPYVELRLGDEKIKTRVHKDGGINPKWHQGLIFNPNGGAHSSHLRVRVYDEGTVSDSRVGRCDIDVYDALAKGYKVDREFQLASDNDFSKIQGFVTLNFDFEGEGGPADPIKLEEEKKAASARAAASEREAIERERAQLQIERQRLEKLTLDAQKAQADALAAKHQAEAAAATAAATAAAAAQSAHAAGATAHFPRHHPHAMTLIRDRYGAGKGYTCDVCKQQGTGLSWHCAACSFDAHPHCVEEEGGRHVNTWMDNKHPHVLTLEGSPYKDGKYVCKKCSKTNAGEAWRCDPCKYDVCLKCKREAKTH